MPKKKKPSKGPKEFISFLQETVKSRNLTYSAIAEGAGLSTSYVSDIASGKRIPEAGVCNAIADFLDVPRIKILNLVGWLDMDEDEQLIQEVREKARSDESFREFLEFYLSEEDETKRKLFIRMLRVGLDK